METENPPLHCCILICLFLSSQDLDSERVQTSSIMAMLFCRWLLQRGQEKSPPGLSGCLSARKGGQCWNGFRLWTCHPTHVNLLLCQYCHKTVPCQWSLWNCRVLSWSILAQADAHHVLGVKWEHQDSRLLYYLSREIKTWLNINHVTVHNNTYFIF